MAASATSPPTTRNRLLAALPPAVLEQLWPQLEPAELSLNETLHTAGQPIEAVFFPESGWASMIAPLEDGDGSEVGLIGRDGLVGLPVLLDAEADDLEALVQQPGTALRMEADAFRAALESHPDFRALLNR